MKMMSRFVLLIAILGVSGCSGGAATALGFGPRCDPHLNRDISIAEQFDLFLQGPPLEDSAYDNNSDAKGGLHEYDTCHGIASVNFQSTSDNEGDFTITPIAVGQCQLTVDDGDQCVTSTVVVHPGSGVPFFVHRRPV
jgi:hypothetical protein